ELALAERGWQVTLKAFHPGERGWAGKAPGAAEEAAEAALEAGAEAIASPQAEAPEVSEVTHRQEEGSIMSGNGGEGSEVLGDVPVQLSVELERIPMSADQVVALRIGQVVELHRGANERVELTINGKAVARGELVEIEGQLGVRVQSLVGWGPRRGERGRAVVAAGGSPDVPPRRRERRRVGVAATRGVR